MMFRLPKNSPKQHFLSPKISKKIPKMQKELPKRILPTADFFWVNYVFKKTEKCRDSIRKIFWSSTAKYVYITYLRYFSYWISAFFGIADWRAVVVNYSCKLKLTFLPEKLFVLICLPKNSWVVVGEIHALGRVR